MKIQRLFGAFLLGRFCSSLHHAENHQHLGSSRMKR